MDFKILKDIFPNLNKEQEEAFFNFYKLLISENEKYNLTAITNEEDVLIKHFYDSLYPFKDMDLNGKNVLDVGSGGGFPLIPLAIIYPHMQGVAIDSNHKKIHFINLVCEALNLRNIKTYLGRAETLAHSELRESFDLVTARAFAPTNIELEILAPFVKVNGLLMTLKSKASESQIKDENRISKLLNLKVDNVLNFALPNMAGERRIVSYLKTCENAKKYPRDFSIIKSKPL